MATGLFVDLTTGQRVVRNLTTEEIAQIEGTAEQRAQRQTAEALSNRRAAFQGESDPLFFEWQRGEGTQADWLTAVADIRNRYPMPDA